MEKQNLSVITDTLNSRLGIKKDSKAASRLAKQMEKIVIELIEVVEHIVDKKIVKEDKRLIKNIKKQQQILREERRSAAVAAFLKNDNYSV